MNKKHFHERNEDIGDISAFEQQLRSTAPTPPKTAWDDMRQLLEQQQTMSVRSSHVPAVRSTARWLRVLTHSAAALIGIGIGVTWVLMLQPAVAKAPLIEAEPMRQVSSEQDRTDVAPKNTANRQMVRMDAHDSQGRILSMFGNQNIVSLPLTPLTPLPRDAASRSQRRIPRDLSPMSPVESETTFEPTASDNPMSAPELMREMLNGVAQMHAS